MIYSTHLKFYRPPNQNRFLEEISKDFNKLHSEKNEVIILGDLNINLLQNGKYTLQIKNSSSSEKVTTHPLLKQYKQEVITCLKNHATNRAIK